MHAMLVLQARPNQTQARMAFRKWYYHFLSAAYKIARGKQQHKRSNTVHILMGI